MDTAGLHEDAILIDGLIISKWSRSVSRRCARAG